MDEREEPCDPVAVPAGLAEAVAGYRWARDRVGEAGAAVYRLHGRAGAPDLYLKNGTGAVADDVTDERQRLAWLAGQVPVPAVRHFERTADAAWLLTTALPGRTAWQVLTEDPDQHGAVVEALAVALRRLHAIPVATCPFDADHRLRLAAARARIDAGLVEEEDFDEARAGWTAQQVWQAMQALLPLAPDPVVTHGDYSLDNMLVVDGVVTGLIDVGRAGVADRWQDLAIMWSCLGEFDPALQAQFLAAYGVMVDEPKRTFHLLLDEMF